LRHQVPSAHSHSLPITGNNLPTPPKPGFKTTSMCSNMRRGGRFQMPSSRPTPACTRTRRPCIRRPRPTFLMPGLAPAPSPHTNCTVHTQNFPIWEPDPARSCQSAPVPTERSAFPPFPPGRRDRSSLPFASTPQPCAMGGMLCPLFPSSPTPFPVKSQFLFGLASCKQTPTLHIYLSHPQAYLRALTHTHTTHRPV